MLLFCVLLFALRLVRQGWEYHVCGPRASGLGHLRSYSGSGALKYGNITVRIVMAASQTTNVRIESSDQCCSSRATADTLPRRRHFRNETWFCFVLQTAK